VTTDWPFKETSWQRYHLRSDGILGVDPGPDGTVQYVSTTAGRGLTGDFGALGPGGTAPFTYTPGLPDTARFELPFERTTAVAGPSVVTLYASTTGADVDFFVEVLDLDRATGDTTFVQRGLLRASFAATLDPKRSSRIGTGPHRGEMYRPYYRFVDSTLLTPLQAGRFEIEVFPFGHVFRAGHSMILQIHAPPTNDPISTYAYEPNQAGVVTIFQEGERRSSILLPFMRRLPPIRPVPPDCGQVVGEICVTPALG
jgi:predicted acyl esterase